MFFRIKKTLNQSPKFVPEKNLDQNVNVYSFQTSKLRF